jgi:hypothetical protein
MDALAWMITIMGGGVAAIMFWIIAFETVTGKSPVSGEGPFAESTAGRIIGLVVFSALLICAVLGGAVLTGFVSVQVVP